MSKLWLTKQGNYVDFNGNVVGSKEKGLTTKAIEYLKSKYGNEYTNRVNSNMRNGNIYQNNTWRGNDPSSTKTQDFSTAINNLKNSYKKDSFGYYFKNYQGDNIYFNQKAAEAKKEWEQLHKNTTNQNPLLIHQIPTKNKIHVIDNYSPNFNYIVEDNKIYFSKKGQPYWRDISDNNIARNNLFNFLHNKYQFKGYDDREKQIYALLKQNKFNYNTFGMTYPKTLSNKHKITKPITHNPSDTEIFISNIKSGNFREVFNNIKGAITRKYNKLFGEDEKSNLKQQESIIKNSKYGIIPQSFTGDTVKVNNRQYIIPENLDINDFVFGVRNRGNYSKLNTEGAVITAFNNFVPYGKQSNNFKTFIGINPQGKLIVGDISKFKKGDLLTGTYSNEIQSFAKINGKLQYREDSKHGNSSRSVPIVITPQGKKGSLNILTNKDRVGNTYGNVDGGRVLVKVGNELRLLSGSIENIEQSFEAMKKRNKSSSGTFYTLDNGTYNRGLRTYDKVLTPKDLKNYDAQNTSGGNFMYIKGQNAFKSDTIWTPNIRTRNSQSYAKGHPLINQQKGIVLHHTAFLEPSLKNVTAHLTNPKSQASSHVIIGYDGTRRVLAKPSQVTFHAGDSRWNGKNNVNDFMIGIEFQGDTNQRHLTDKQIQSAIEYMTPIIRKNNIRLEDITTHQEVRKLYNQYNALKAPSKPDINYYDYNKIIDALKHRLYYYK